MKIFSIVGIIVGIILTVLNIIDGDILTIVSSISMSVGFIFLFLYYKSKSEKFMNLFAVFLAIYAFLSLIKMFTEKGYF